MTIAVTVLLFIISVIVIAAAAVYMRILADMGTRNIVSAGVLLCIISYWNGLSQQYNLFAGIEYVYLLLAAFVTGMAVLKIKHGRALFYFVFCYQVLAMLCPMLYDFVYPDNNLKEDISWNVYDAETLVFILVVSAVITILFYRLNKVWWKTDSMWIFNVITGAFVMGAGLFMLQIVLPVLSVVIKYASPAILIALLFLCQALSRTKPVIPEQNRKRLAVSAVAGPLAAAVLCLLARLILS